MLWIVKVGKLFGLYKLHCTVVAVGGVVVVAVVVGDIVVVVVAVVVGDIVAVVVVIVIVVVVDIVVNVVVVVGIEVESSHLSYSFP